MEKTYKEMLAEARKLWKKIEEGKENWNTHERFFKDLSFKAYRENCKEIWIKNYESKSEFEKDLRDILDKFDEVVLMVSDSDQIHPVELFHQIVREYKGDSFISVRQENSWGMITVYKPYML